MSLNLVTLIGYTGRDPEIRYTPNGTAVANFPLATSEKWTGKDGEKKESTDWHRIVCFQKTAEIVGEYVKKGQQICVTGKIKTRQWEDKEDVKRWTTEIIANRVVFLGKKQDSGEHPAFEKPPENQEVKYDDDIPF
jgi:single-strand DNA-binding protein